jgi:hypothetical protein
MRGLFDLALEFKYKCEQFFFECYKSFSEGSDNPVFVEISVEKKNHVCLPDPYTVPTCAALVLGVSNQSQYE